MCRPLLVSRFVMIDFHTHVLPEMDDGAENISESLLMLRSCVKQGVDIVFATSHFYADEDDPDSFLERRNKSYNKLIDAMGDDFPKYPSIIPASEVLFFPGMSTAADLKKLAMGDLPCILIEPPMITWTESILDEIEQTGINLKLLPVVAHIDRYMRMLNDYSLIDRVLQRRMLVQVNTSFFIYDKTRKKALSLLENGKIHLIGSDCHNTTDRTPNMGEAFKIIRENIGADKVSDIVKKSYRMVGKQI